MIGFMAHSIEARKKEQDGTTPKHESIWNNPFHSENKQGGHGLNSKPVKKSEMGGGKGVGGYRPPMVSWRDKALSLKRKNVAECQILWCVIISGIIIVLAGCIISILAFTVISSQCPFGWSVKEEGTSCFYRTEHNATMNEGHSYCADQGGYMLHIENKKENDFFDAQKSGPTWLGMRRHNATTKWTWTSSTKPVDDSFASWDKQDNDATCAQLVDSGMWTQISNCSSEAYVICEFKPGYNPFMLIGPVIALCGVILLLMSIETCIRRREFLEKNGTELMDDVDDQHEIDEGLTNYGYGNFGGNDSPKKLPWPTMPPTNKTAPTTPVKPQREEISPSRSRSRPHTPGPVVHVVPASIPTSPLPVPQTEDNSTSQEQLELLLSPKTLQ